MNTDDEYKFVTSMISSTETRWVILIIFFLKENLFLFIFFIFRSDWLQLVQKFLDIPMVK